MELRDRQRDPFPQASVGLRWTEPEVAWPLALVAGFLGAYLGVATTIPGMSALFAVFAFAPIYLAVSRRGSVRLAAVLAAGWIFAVGAATCAAVLDSTFSDVADAVPGAWYVRNQEFAPGLSEGTGGRAGSDWSRVSRNASILAVILVVARPSSGLLSLLGLAGIAAAMGAGVGWFVELAQEGGAEPALLALKAVPPHHAVLAIGTVLLATVIADARPPWMRAWAKDTGSNFDIRRRQLLAAGSVLSALGLALDPLLAARWAAWLGSAIGP